MSRLSVTFFADEPCEQPANMPSTVNTELIEYIWRKSQEAGFLGIAALAKTFAGKNNNKIIRNLKIFNQTSRLNKNYMIYLHKLLNLDKAEIDAINKRHRDRLYAEEDLLISNFELLLLKSNLILESERYRNITFHGLFISSAWVGRRRPLTLGELFFHYKRGDWIMPDCCGSVYVLSGGGSPLSGSNSYQGYCRTCKKIFFGSRPSFSELLGPFLKDEPDFEYIPTDCTVRHLVADLVAKEALG